MKLAVKPSIVTRSVPRQDGGKPYSDGLRRLPFAEFVESHIERDPNSGCWLWSGPVSMYGYGRLKHRDVGPRERGAHRAIYEMYCAPVDPTLSLDHLCRTPLCVNPKHLEPVTPGVNALRGNGAHAKNARKTHCLHGHPLAGKNLAMRHGSRICRACGVISTRAYRARQKA